MQIIDWKVTSFQKEAFNTYPGIRRLYKLKRAEEIPCFCHIANIASCVAGITGHSPSSSQELGHPPEMFSFIELSSGAEGCNNLPQLQHILQQPGRQQIAESPNHSCLKNKHYLFSFSFSELCHFGLERDLNFKIATTTTERKRNRCFNLGHATPEIRHFQI